MLNMLSKNYASYFARKKDTICMKCQILFSGKNQKNIVNMLSAELAQSMVKGN